jgi:hypothetical protein
MSQEENNNFGGFAFGVETPKFKIHRGRMGEMTEVIVWVDSEGEVAFVAHYFEEIKVVYMNGRWSHLYETFMDHTKKAIQNFRTLYNNDYVLDGKKYSKFVITFAIH